MTTQPNNVTKPESKAGVPVDSIHPHFSEARSRPEIAALAYELWQSRGCPDGSPEEDWFRAEQELHSRQTESLELPITYTAWSRPGGSWQ